MLQPSDYQILPQWSAPAIILTHFPFHTGRLSSITTGTSTESMHSVEEQSTPPVKRKCIHDEYVTTPTSGLEQASIAWFL